MAQCYENRFFCKQCDYSTEKKINYLRHVKRNHSSSEKDGGDRPSCSRVEDACDDNSVADTTRSKETDGEHGSSSEDEEAWLSKDPDVSIGEAIETEHLEERSQEVETGTANDPTVRKRTSPMPVYSPASPKVVRPCVIPVVESEQRDPRAQINTSASAEVLNKGRMVDSCTQTEPVRYTKSITTTTIVKEGGKKVITVKKEKML